MVITNYLVTKMFQPLGDNREYSRFHYHKILKMNILDNLICSYYAFGYYSGAKADYSPVAHSNYNFAL